MTKTLRPRRLREGVCLDLGFRRVRIHNSGGSMGAGSRHDKGSRKLSAYIVNCKHKAERANRKWNELFKSQGLPSYSGMLPPARSHLLNLSQPVPQTGDTLQLPDIIGNVSLSKCHTDHSVSLHDGPLCCSFVKV